VLEAAIKRLEDQAAVSVNPTPCTLKRVSEVDSSCRLLIVPLFRGSSRFERLILSHHSRFACECNKAEIDDDDDDAIKRLEDQAGVSVNFFSLLLSSLELSDTKVYEP